MTNCFVHMIEFEQTIEFCALPTQICWSQHGTHDWSRLRGLSWDTSDAAPDTIDRQPRISLLDFNVLIHVINSTKIVAAAPWRSKTLVAEKGKPQYSISGSLEIQGMVRGYSFDIQFTLQCGNIQSGYSEDIPSMVFLLPARAHLKPNQGSSGLALVSRLKLDQVSLMGIRVEFETKCQCLHWSLIKSLRKQICSVSSLFRIPFWWIDKRWCQLFLSPWSTFDRQPPTGRLLICCSSLSKGGDHKKYWHQNYLAKKIFRTAKYLPRKYLFCKIISTQKHSALKIKHSFEITKRWVWKPNSKSCVRIFCPSCSD